MPSDTQVIYSMMRVGDMVDSIYSLDQGLEAVERAGQTGVLKVLIRP